jgi:citrate lyase subunit beta / citryl-CoA lyase
VTGRPSQPPLRSLLYVPGNKLEWMLKAPRYGADALILDLEDSVPPDQKVASRAVVRQAIDELGKQAKPRLFVRVNSFPSGLTEGDVEGVMGPGLFGVYLPKTEGPEEVSRLAARLDELEARMGLPAGQVFIRPMLEGAKGIHNAFAIAQASPRVAYLGTGGTGHGDIARSLGYRHREGMLESLFIRSKVLLEARAADITNPIAGLFANIQDVAGLRVYAERERDLGYMGMHCIHPSQVAIANEVFRPTPAEVERWRGLVEAVEAGQRQGTAAVVYQGEMVDIAHLTYARQMLALAADYDRTA